MNAANEDEAVVGWLCKPDNYPHRPDHVDHVQTHISHVFLAGPLVYKLKKPVRFDFLDFSTVANREQACREEVRLNRRLAAETYLGVKPIIRGPDGEFRWEGDGEVVDWVVEMRRLPTELTLDALHQRGALEPKHIELLTAMLVNFYRGLAPLPVAPQQYRERCLSHVRGNLRELLAVKHHLPRGAVERIHGYQLQLLQLQPAIFDERVLTGRIVDGHGDLRPEHICFSDVLVIFDCIEFNADLRRIDVADELAFLAAECDFLGAEWVGPYLLRQYQALSGDEPPDVLWDFYKSYRACVRAKVAALRADQLKGPEQQAAADQARRHLTLADGYVARRLRPLVIAVGGLAGTGKTTLAKALTDALGAELLRTDVIRQELFGGGSGFLRADEGVYSEQSRRVVYEEMFRRATAQYVDRLSIVLDGTFSKVESVTTARALASDPQSMFLAVECVCRPELAHQRIIQRLAAGQDASEARPEIHDMQRFRWEPWPSDIRQVQVDTEHPLDAQVKQVIGALAALQ
jgi:aminoglycoside phosphotransferase family enzyme/predicted kinase